jgi:hypothetical protein
MDLCNAESNQGFPVNIQGPLSDSSQLFMSIKGQPEIYMSFGTYGGQRFLYSRDALDKKRWGKSFINDTLNSTLTYKGILYSIKTIQICNATHSGSTWPRKPANTNAMDLVFTFTRQGFDNSYPTSFLVIIPLYSMTNVTVTSSSSKNTEAFFRELIENTKTKENATPRAPTKNQFPSMSSLFEDLTNTAAVMYMSCISLRPPQINKKWVMKSTNIGVLYFPGGWIIQDQSIFAGLQGVGPYILPAEVRMNYLTAVGSPPLIGSDEKTLYNFLIDGNNWSSEGLLRGNVISTGDALKFNKMFKWIDNAIEGIGKSEKRLKSTFEYQCLPLDKVKDVKGNLVLLDPATGTRSLADTLEGSSQEDKDALNAARKSGSAATTFAVVLGSILALLIVFIGGSYIVRWILKRRNTIEGQAAVAAAAIAIGNAISENVNQGTIETSATGTTGSGLIKNNAKKSSIIKGSTGTIGSANSSSLNDKGPTGFSGITGSTGSTGVTGASA